MNNKTKYKTKQRDILIEYLESVPKTHITAGDVCEHFKRCGTSIGKAMVYRQLEGLVDEGVLQKYIIDTASPACFEYVGGNIHHSGEACFHCKCERCGKLIHLHCEELSAIGNHLMEHHGFRLNPLRTVFYGVCEDCAASEAEDREESK